MPPFFFSFPPVARKILAGMALLSCLLACLLTVTAHAQTALDSFDYPAGATLNSQNGGTGWAGPWVAPNVMVIASKGKPFMGKMVATGNAVGIFADMNQFLTADRTAGFTFGQPGTTEWFSFLITRVHYNPAAANPPAYGGLSLGGFHGLFVGDTGNGHWGMDNAGKSLQGFVNASRVTEDAPTFLVLRADFHSDVDKFTLYENPTPGLTDPDIPGIVKQDIEIGPSTLVQFAYGNGNAYVVDELRLGSSYADVAPSLTPTVPAPADTGIAGKDLTPKQAVEAAYVDINRAMRRRDIEAVVALQSASFEREDAAGNAAPLSPDAAKAALSAIFHANPSVLNDTVVDDVTVDDGDNSATVKAHDRLTLMPKSGPGVRIETTVSDHWVREDGVWHLDRRQVLTVHRTKIKGPATTKSAPKKRTSHK